MSATATMSCRATTHDTLLGDAGWQALVLHDLRAPLAVVSGQAQLLRRRLGKADVAAADEAQELALRLDRILRAATHMAGMLDELQALGRGDRGLPPPPRCQRTDLVEVARRVVADRAEQAPERLIRLLAAEAPLVGYWDAGRVERALDNLVGNAVKYSPDGGEITLLLWRERRSDRDWAAVAVRDRGVGIPAADLPHVFERFYRASNVAGRFEGVGLGLAGVRQVVEQHGGTVAVESQEGRGTTFTVRLPLASESGAGASV